MIDTFRNPEQGLVVVDVGDSLLSKGAARRHPVTPGDLIGAETMLQALSLLDTHALVPGELELAAGLGWLKKTAASAGVPLLCANLRDRRGRLALPPYKIIETGGIKVGLLGLVDFAKVVDPLKPVLKREKVRATDLEAVTRAGIKALRKGGAQLIVVLGHIGMARARELATKVSGIHLVLVGHSGSRTGTPQKAGQTYLVEAGERGRELGHLEIRLGESWDVTRALTDDSQRYALYKEAQEVEKDVRKRLAGQKPAERGQGMEASIARAKHLNKQYRDLPPQGRQQHIIISSLVELNGKVLPNLTINGLVQGRARKQAAAGAKAPSVRVIPTRVQIR